ncbi:CdaR family transcriptional regulator [Pseudonocardia sp. WMMC193]|uniref:PucR family transcriptional regulator n=1 Tax=Pseudonocardia sp. WMMC193 TaxID=2911965 RepID=UPI001F1A1D77|nr:PucR family transcriptional regulator [Pseudonocardia sp. WMMC193]MCF7552269.1 helix-turn-helix domain-containing protein [Pseudonocardia sp. WMMC193]
MAALVESLRTESSLVEQTIRDVRANVPAYSGVPTESLVASMKRNRSLAARVLSEGVVPPSPEIWEADSMTAERLHQGVEIQDILGGFRVVIATIQRWVVDQAPAHGLDVRETLLLSQLLWRLGDAVSARAAMTFRQEGITGALADEQRRAEWVVALLTGTTDDAVLNEGWARYGVDRRRLYLAVCTAEIADHELGRLRTRLTESVTREPGGHAVLVPSEGRLVGVATHPPRHAGVVVAVGPVDQVGELPSSFTVAQRVLAAARLHADDGTHTVGSETWRLGVPLTPEVGEVLVARYISPLREQGAFGGLVIEALQAWLAHQRSIPRAAASVPTHVNTLRYRLARFEELTGRSLEDTDTIVELSWALLAAPSVS